MNPILPRNEIVDRLIGQAVVFSIDMTVKGAISPVTEIEKEQGIQVDVYPLARVRTRTDRRAWEIDSVIRVAVRQKIEARTEAEKETAEEAFIGVSVWVERQLMTMNMVGPYGIMSIAEGAQTELEYYNASNVMVSIIDVTVRAYAEG